jgi:hypothetical protein
MLTTQCIPKRFGTEEEARETIAKEYTNRNKNDGHDDYWNNRKQIIIKQQKRF